MNPARHKVMNERWRTQASVNSKSMRMNFAPLPLSVRGHHHVQGLDQFDLHNTFHKTYCTLWCFRCSTRRCVPLQGTLQNPYMSCDHRSQSYERWGILWPKDIHSATQP